MRNTIHILNASGSLVSLDREIKRTAKSTLVKANRHLKFKGVDIIIRPTNNTSLKSLSGISGYCPEPHYVDISIDKRYTKSKKLFALALERTLLHELHHAARQQQGFSFKNITVYQQMIAEGSADYFVYQMTGKIPVWAKPPKDEQRLMKMLKPVFNKRITEDQYTQLFLVGDAKRKIPKWTGYALGFAMVKAEQEKYTFGHLLKKVLKQPKLE